MAIVAPFRAVRYNLERIKRIEDVVSPPYDIIDSQAQAALLAQNPYNMIRLDLSKNVKTQEMTPARYAGAAELFVRWQKEGILLREEQPAFYLYDLDYQQAGSLGRVTRRGLLARVQLTEFGEGIVKPHEKTFSGVTLDRLRLLEACQAQFSSIFSLYSDPRGEVVRLLEQARGGAAPLYRVSDQDGCEHRLWAVSDTEALTAVQAFFRDKALYIADGHHRYTTALQYRALQREGAGGESPANYTMMYLCAMEDPGLSVLPTHRLLRLPGNKSAAELLAALEQSFAVDEISAGSRESLLLETLARMAERGTGGPNTHFGCYHPGEDRSFLLTLKAGVMDQEAGHRPAALRSLDVVVLSDLIIDRLPGLDQTRCVQGDLIDYFSDPDEALDVAIKESRRQSEYTPLLFLMNATLVEQVRRVADENLVMPHKSTFFYPKPLTGLAINPLTGC